MKFAAPLVAASFACVAWVSPQVPLPASLLGHAKSLANAPGLRAVVTVHPPSGAEETATILLGKPMKFRVDGPRRLLVGDGNGAADLDRSSNTYTRLKTDPPLAPFAQEPAAWLFLAFFEPDATKLVKSAKTAGKRKVGGKSAEVVEASLADGTLATLFVGEESGLAVGGQFTREGKTWLVLVNETELLNEAPPEGEFAFSAPAGAKERSAAPAADGWAPVSKIFQGNCMPCHGANMAGGLDLRTYAAAAKSRSIVPGNPGASSMVAYVRGTRAPRMPIGRAPLSEADTKAIEAWIAGGAKE